MIVTSRKAVSAPASDGAAATGGAVSCTAGGAGASSGAPRVLAHRLNQSNILPPRTRGGAKPRRARAKPLMGAARHGAARAGVAARARRTSGRIGAKPAYHRPPTVGRLWLNKALVFFDALLGGVGYFLRVPVSGYPHRVRGSATSRHARHVKISENFRSLALKSCRSFGVGLVGFCSSML